MKPFFAAALSALALVAPLAAQVPATARSLGMAGAYLPVARGQEAIFLNPANLAAVDNPPRSFGLGQLALGASVFGPETGDLWDVIAYDDISDERAREILSKLTSGYAETELDLRLPIVTYQRGQFGVGLRYGMATRASLGRDLLELLFLGYEPGRTDYRVGNTTTSGASYLDLAVAYGHRFGPLGIGVTGHILRGSSVHRSRIYEPIYSAGDTQIEVDIASASGRGGFGASIDLGAIYQPASFFTVSAAVQNPVGGISWERDRSYKTITIDEHDLPGTGAEQLLKEFNESSTDLQCPAPQTDRRQQRACELAAGIDDGVQLPRTAQIGAALTLPTRTDLAATYRTEIQQSPLGGWWRTMASVGLQQKLGPFAVRAGYATNLQSGDDAGRLVSGGLSLGPLHLGVGRLDAAREGFIGSIGLGVPF